MLKGIWSIFKKELLDTLRDRKTLIFMLLIPTLAMPLLMVGISRLFQSVQKAEQVRPVVIVADQPTQDAYRQLMHDWFLQSDLGKGFKIVDAPILRALIKPEAMGAFGAIPPNISRDPAVFDEWLHQIAEQARENLDSVDEQAGSPVAELPDEMKEAVVNFYRIAIKGYALVEFRDPAEIETAPDDFQLREDIPEELNDIPRLRDYAYAINTRQIQGVLTLSGEYASIKENDETGIELEFLHDSTIPLSREARDRMSTVAWWTKEVFVRTRLDGRNISHTFLEPVRMADHRDMASTSRQTMEVLGSILPYLMIVFAFLGGMYPAIDLGAGEKERNTLETLLLSPSSRTQIALGKFFVILTTSLTAAILGVVSMAISYQYILPRAVIEMIDLKIEWSLLLPIALLIIPPSAAFAGIFLAISIYARSFKEAQSYMAPLQFVLILPAMAPIVPGIELNWKLAMIPLVNVSMLSKEFLKGDPNWGYYGLTLISCALLATACIAFCVRQFSREEVLFRS